MILNIHKQFFTVAGTIVSESACYQVRCGSVIVAKDKTVIGRGYNAPPLGDESQRQCAATYQSDKKPKSDKTCCIHAEWNAILDALAHHPDKIVGSTLYFMRVDSDGEFTQAGQPYCTVCSRLALQSGIKTFGLWNNGPQMIDTKQYNVLSYDYFA